MAVSARPSPPYRDWADANSRPLTWMEAATHLDDKLGKLRPRSSAAARSPGSPGIPALLLASRYDRRLMIAFVSFPIRAAVSVVILSQQKRATSAWALI